MNKFEWNEQNFGRRPPLKLGMPIGFGEHANRTIEELCEKNLDYLNYLIENGVELDNEAFRYFQQRVR